MNVDNKEYNHREIVEWLEDKFDKLKNKNVKIYKDLEKCSEFQADLKNVRYEAKKEKGKFFIYPRLSIDLIRVESKPEKTEKSYGKDKGFFNYYSLFFAISSKTILKNKINDLMRRLSFYQFYFSRISEPKRFEITVVIPHYIDELYIDELSENVKIFKENGFGLWKININKKKERVLCKSKSLRKRMINQFQESVDKPKDLGGSVKKIFINFGKNDLKNFSIFKETVKKKAEDFAIFFDQYILDTVDAIAGVTLDKFGRRYIDRLLLNKMFDLENVSYSEKLKKLVNEHLDEDGDDYQFVSEVFSTLWEENIGMQYSKFLETFEPALLHIFAEGEKERDIIYRDHYIHQFQVFLLGIYIIDKFYDDFKNYFKNYKCEKPEISWLITSSFHDMSYPVQLYDEWSKEFFKKVFHVEDIKLANLDLKSSFIESFLSCMGYIICSLCCSHEKEKELKDNWLADKKELVQFFYKEITEKKNHCLLSSISLLRIILTADFNKKNMIKKKISNNKYSFEDIFKKNFVPSALAIAIHDKKVWQKLRKQTDKDNPPKILYNMEFEKDPLSFLLIFCDNIQEWGRPSKSREKNELEREMKFYLKNINCDSKKGLDITICTYRYSKSEQFFIEKQEELSDLQFFLKQASNLSFTIHLKDKDGKDYEYKMEGCKVLS